MLLVIDDERPIRSLIAAFGAELGWEVDQAEDGGVGVELVRQHPDRYEVVLLDVQMPGPSGLEVLPELLKYGRDLAVIMISGYAEVHSAVESMQRGAYDFLEKPLEVDILETRLRKALAERRLRVEHREYVQDIERKVRERTTELDAARRATIFGLARLAEYRDEETGFHLERMAHYSVALAEGLRENGLYRDELDEGYLSNLLESAPLHDIGKVGVPDSILLKPGKLTPAEFELMKIHTVIGARAIADIQALVGGQTFLQFGQELARSHHEHFDGSGYPDGLEGTQIPLSARILTLADFYDALTWPRVYRPFAYSHDQVREMIGSERGSKFDPDIVDCFFSCQARFTEIHRLFQD